MLCDKFQRTQRFVMKHLICPEVKYDAQNKVQMLMQHSFSYSEHSLVERVDFSSPANEVMFTVTVEPATQDNQRRV